MIKKLAFGTLAFAIAIVSVPLLSAFEAHVINVTATIENALSVLPMAIEFGTVFPEEQLHQPLTISMGSSFLEQNRVLIVNYFIRQKPKCVAVNGASVQVTEDGNAFVCPSGSTMLPLLCPFLSKHSSKTSDTSVNALHGPITGWTLADTEKYQASGELDASTEGGKFTAWDIDLTVPCFKGKCAQDNIIPLAYQLDPSLEHQLFGCDLWVEVSGIHAGEETPVCVPQCSGKNCGDDGCGGSCGTCTMGNYCTDQSVCAPQVDGDGDGFFSIATGGNDCDEGNAPNHPGAEEICDLRDNNCDGQVDEGGVCVCTPLTGRTCHTGNLGICSGGMSDCADDGSGWSECIQVNQPTTEVCDDGLDNDCDGQIDEGCIAPTLLFSEYIEGSSNNKALEIYNPTGSSVDLSEYKIDRYANGASTPSSSYTLSGTLAAGGTYIICHPLFANSAICNLTSSTIIYNGNDAVALRKTNGDFVDVIGQIGYDPGTEWGSGLTSTADNTLVRKCGITHGDIIGSDIFDPATEWNGYAVDTFSYLGSHNLVCP